MLDLIRFITGGIGTRGPIHPGEHLAVALQTVKASPAELAQTIEVQINRVTDIISGRGAVTVDMAMHLGRYFGTSATLWMSLHRVTSSNSPNER